MERRDFLRAVGVAVSAAVVPLGRTLTLKRSGGAVVAPVGFDGKKPMGMSFSFSPRSEEVVAKARDALLADARKHLPGGTRFYVLDGGNLPMWQDGEVVHGDMLAWFYSPVPITAPLKYRVIAEAVA